MYETNKKGTGQFQKTELYRTFFYAMESVCVRIVSKIKCCQCYFSFIATLIASVILG